MDKIYKAYLFKNLYKDVSKFLRSSFRRWDFDKEHWLHKAGLTPYRPAKSALGGLALLMVGGVTGAVIALMFAPKAGMELRTDVKDRAMRLFDRAAGQASEAIGETAPARA